VGLLKLIYPTINPSANILGGITRGTLPAIINYLARLFQIKTFCVSAEKLWKCARINPAG
jgi:hypothetical protein